MKTPLQITFRDIEHSDALEVHIREKAQKLETFFEPIMSCRVVVEMPHQHKHQGKVFNVRIDIGVPGSEIVVNRDRHEDVYVALRDAFDAAKRQLDDYSRRLRRETKAHEPEYIGQVVRLYPEEGFGFIRRTDGDELYFSADNLVNTTFGQLSEGVAVKFIEDLASEGPQAKRVSVGQHQLPE
ncbi:ribosome hibernation-promoting factor, HPF/YfiA family [Thiobacillus sedimenti]|uniref:Ribosome-associated translation inhibitor RaiA n=1 Tax=Thiobacillus sedimenti TaxID=3110231 RepID=A0ABZ1CNG3_9PROT|nr:ribosome-associated translation inhibitor RaiA [Thiobacillus sp. SCUT-2]WRS40435.1 ribosome-associated translation inhibitor RaiA [Thiobacillus sp. SCUT-2]